MSELFDDRPDAVRPEAIVDVRGEVRLRQAERRQVELCPVLLDEPIASDHLARLVWQPVQRFDLTSLRRSCLPIPDRFIMKPGRVRGTITQSHRVFR